MPAYRVGIADNSIPLIGLLNIQMDINSWIAGSNLEVGGTFESQVQLIDPSAARLTITTTVGEVPFEHTPDSSLLNNMGYVVLTDGTIEDINGNQTRRIVGFGLATNVELDGDQIVFSRDLPQPIATQNASATARRPQSGDWSSINLSSLFQRISDHYDNGSLLLAPALVRSIE